MILLNIPIEPIEERYSVQWDKWFKEHFEKEDFDIITVYGLETSGKIKNGAFLDIEETNMYKTQQLLNILTILKEIDTKENIVLFFHDLWFPGLINIAYIRDGLKLDNLKICGCLHAGAYDPNDFLAKQMGDWVCDAEIAMLNIPDYIFVATEYHKELLIDGHSTLSQIMVTGFPIYDEFVDHAKKRMPYVLFPHRLDPEKNPHVFDTYTLEAAHSGDWQKTKELCKSKAEYYELLNKGFCAVSCADQETWGIAMQEAVLCGCYPIVPNRLSYTEMYPMIFKYEGDDAIPDMIESFKTNPPNLALMRLQETIKMNGKLAIPTMIEYIKNLAT